MKFITGNNSHLLSFSSKNWTIYNVPVVQQLHQLWGVVFVVW